MPLQLAAHGLVPHSPHSQGQVRQSHGHSQLLGSGNCTRRTRGQVRIVFLKKTNKNEKWELDQSEYTHLCTLSLVCPCGRQIRGRGGGLPLFPWFRFGSCERCPPQCIAGEPLLPSPNQPYTFLGPVYKNTENPQVHIYTCTHRPPEGSTRPQGPGGNLCRTPLALPDPHLAQARLACPLRQHPVIPGGEDCCLHP